MWHFLSVLLFFGFFLLLVWKRKETPLRLLGLVGVFVGAILSWIMIEDSLSRPRSLAFSSLSIKGMKRLWL